MLKIMLFKTLFILSIVIYFSIVTIFSQNPLNSVVSFVMVVLGSCLFLFKLQLHFISFILILIYLSGIVILFVFVIFVFDCGTQEFILISCENIKEKLFCYLLVLKAIYFSYIFNVEYLLSIIQECNKEYLTPYNQFNYNMSLINSGFDFIIFRCIFTENYIFFVIISLILLISMLGSIVIISHKK